MSLKHGLLGLLNYEPMTGYDLNKEFNGSLGYFWTAKASQIYRELDAMEKCGWLTSERVIQDEKPNKRVYSLTAQGKSEFMNWLSSLAPIKGPRSMRNAFMMRVFFGGELRKEQTLELLRAIREIMHERLEQMQKVYDEIDSIALIDERTAHNAIYWKLTALSGEIINQAQLEWADKSIEILESTAEEKGDENE